jgi:hypothetical protein
MKNIFYLLLLFFILGCSKDEVEILEPEPTIEYIFLSEQTILTQNQTINFELPLNGIYFLIIKDINVISKEKFNGIKGVNSRLLYTKVLPKGKLKLILQNESKEQLHKTLIIVQ